MFTKIFFRLPVVVAMLLLAGLPLAAQGHRGGPPQSGTPVISSPPVLVTVNGSVQRVDFHEGYPNFELKATDGETYLIFVGPLRYLDDNDFELQTGDLVTAAIFRDPQSNNAWVAAVLNNQTTGQTLTLRDASGLPLWVRRGNSGHTGFGGGAGQAARQGQGLAALHSGQPAIDLTTLATYGGTVTKINIAAGENHPTIEVRLQSGATALFCLGPWRYLDQIGFTASEGDSVLIKAADCTQDADEYVVFSITISGRTWLLRSENGTPIWYGGYHG